jgi:hypothetical protein
MCDPATIAILGTTVSAMGSITAGIAAQRQGQFQAKVAEQNAKMADESARDAIEQGKRDNLLHYRRQAQLQGTQRAAMAANGIDLSFGSALNVQGDTKMIGREDADAISENAMRASRGYSIEAINYRGQASASRMEGKAGLIGGIGEGFSTALGGASKAMQLSAGRTPRRSR